MTVKELKEKLSEFSDDMTIVVSGYENGYDNIYRSEKINVFKRTNKDWWDGSYRDSKNEPEQQEVIFLK